MDPLVILLIVVAVLLTALVTAAVLFIRERRAIAVAASERADQLIEQGMGSNGSSAVQELPSSDKSYQDAA